VRKWQVSGPYTKAAMEGENLFNVAFGPEIDMSGTWDNVSFSPGQREIDLSELIGGQHRVAYLRTRFRSPVARQAVLELGSDDGVKVWLNRTLVHANNVTRGVSAGEDRVEVDLRQGRNFMLVKVTQGVGGWGFTACLADKDGEVLTDLEY